MTFAQPLALLGLVALPLAWLLGRLRRRPLEVTVPSLLLWERIPPSVLEAAPPRGLRRVDVRLLLELAALALLVLGAAGPEIAASVTPPRTVALAIDDRAAQAAVDAGGRVRFEGVRDAARQRIRALGPRDRVVLAFASEDAPRPPMAPADALAVVEAAAPSRRPGADLAAAVAACRASPDVDEVHALWAGGGESLHVLGRDPRAPAWNAGIVVAGARSLPDGRLQALVTVVVHGWAAPPVRLVCADPPVDLLVLGGAGSREMLLDLGARTTPVTLAVVPGGSLALDDRVTLSPPAPAARVLLTTAAGARPEPRLRDALRASGADLVETPAGADGDGILVAEGFSGPVPRPGRAVAAIAGAAALPPGAPPPGRIRPRDGSPFRHADLSAVRVLVAPAPPPPDLRPAFDDEQGRPVAGTIEDERGRLVWVGFPLDPGASDWTKDRSFPIFWAEALAWLAARDAPDRARGLWTSDGLLDEAETRAAAEERAPDAALLEGPPALGRQRPEPVAGAVRLGPFGIAAGGFLLAAAWAAGAFGRRS